MRKKSKEEREQWSSALAFVWAAAGAAVGLGNIWKFPYMAGAHGGSAFVLMYLFFLLLVSMPVMVAEIMLGKLSKRNPVDGFSYLARRHGLSERWRWVGYLGTLTLQLVFCFYSVVAGFSIAYLYFGASNTFADKSANEIEQIWHGLLGMPEALVACSLLFVGLTMAIVYFGIKKGIEKACAMMMPGLLVVLVVLVGYSALSGGLAKAINFLFAFEPQAISRSVIIASLGHALFTLAVGACAMMVYGSYLPKRVSVMKSVFVIAALDLLVALLSGLAIFPLIFEHDLSPASGPGLMFISLPIVFTHIPFGGFWASLFFLLLLLAALSSSLSFAEPLVDLLMEKLAISRRYAVFAVTALTGVGTVFCALSFNVFSDFKIAGRWSIFDFVADCSTNLFLPLGALLISLFAGLVVKYDDLFSPQQRCGLQLFKGFQFLTLIIAPIAILIVLINGLAEMWL